MVLNQQDVADISFWHKDRQASLLTYYTERKEEREVIKEERNILGELDKIRNDILGKRISLKDARKQLEKMLGPKGDLAKFLESFEGVMNFNFKMVAAVAYAIVELAKIAGVAAAKHRMPQAMAKDTLTNLKLKGKDLEEDLRILRLEAQKVETLEERRKAG